MREKQKQNFDKRHQVQDLRPLVPGDSVWPPEIQAEGTIEKEVSPRSYRVSTPYGLFRSKCQHLRPIPDLSTSVCDSHHEQVLGQESVPSSPTEDLGHLLQWRWKPFQPVGTEPAVDVLQWCLIDMN